MKIKKRAAAFALCISMLVCCLPSYAQTDPETGAASEPVMSGEYDAWKNISEALSREYIDETLSVEQIMQMGISNLLNGSDEMLVLLLKKTLESLDDYSTFYTADEYADYINNLNRTFYGVGIELRKTGQYAEITGFVEENSLAEQTGFKVGDKIICIEGKDISDKSLDEIKKILMGEINTTINMTVMRDNKEIDLIATRTEVKEATVIGEILPGNIGYIRIVSFSQDTAAEFIEVQQYFEQNNIKNIIMNLRDNPGGLVPAAVKIAQMIVPKGKIVDVRYRQPEYDTVYYSELPSTNKNYMVLVNENTASSAEILASAMQDSGVGKLVGTQTFGKAVVQRMYPLANGSVYKLTTGQYLTRNGRQINKVGLTPDIKVDNYTEKIDTEKYNKMDFENRYSLGNNSEAIKAAKERLFMLGIYKGSVDNGLFTEELQDAVKEFQYVNNLSASGVLDIATEIRLEKKFSQLQRVVDEQMKKAYELLGGNTNDL